MTRRFAHGVFFFVLWMVLILCMSFTGCARQMPAGAVSDTLANISEVELKDGTHCVIADYHGTGIACDWRR